MANRTDKFAKSIHGTNPQNLVEKITRNKIQASVYWKEKCFGLSAETLIDRAVELRSVGGMYGEPNKPTEFVCLILKMLQIQPDFDIVVELIRNEDYKYVRLLGAFYLRLVGRALDVYTYMEPLYNDFRKVRLRTSEGGFVLSHVDAVVDDMLRKDYLFDIALPHIPNRLTMENTGQLEPRVSVLDEEFNEAATLEALEAEAGEAAEKAAALREEMGAAGGDERERERERERREERAREKWRLGKDERRDTRERPRGGSRSRSRSRERERRRPDERRHGSRSRSRSRERERERRRPDERRRSRSRSRSRSRDRYRERERGRDRDYDRRGGGGSGGGGYRDREQDRRGGGERERERDRGGGGEGGGRGAAAAAGGGVGKGRAADPNDPEVAEQNALRAKLGLPPLK
ncbi:Pre-mRNA-splicing factor 38A [Monoraphidium neglectum]|uniref:Pre-mRNA-splicing factor 38 n=1 Tax=Monoraphidium neglectum TaxID=145388 RepID=A0A0D2MW08_9CHLO|nr:Pre-mRNA-splicing factor 38A [Monoraphidium neglectum]KIZ06700.1 Pre-mRNA-splicing factor 38A [Monoraphidium neglectum]|eukprot:XP_013905719.1 Pre-mRNA-splicing factor 38A [Monoraphidium neglectum]